MTQTFSPHRRAALQLLGAGALAAGLPARAAFARAATDRRLVLVLLRGALDGLAAAPPLGDPAYAALRGDYALSQSDATPALALNADFALHPALKNLKALYDAGQMTLLHAAAIPVVNRSHFEAQAILETGGVRTGGSVGWLNRALGPLGVGTASEAVAYAPAMPLALSGPAPATSYTPAAAEPGSAEFFRQVAALYGDQPALAKALATGLEVRDMAELAAHDGGAPDDMAGERRGRRIGSDLKGLAATAGRMMADDDGVRIAVLEAGGWDTHVNQGAAGGQLATRLGQLDDALATLRTALGDAWAATAVIVATEFGRTARFNGSGGTDHGVGAAAFLLGGAVAGGRVIANWPGVADRQLHEGRDLAGTTDIRSLFKGVLADHMRLSTSALETAVFPDSAAARPLQGLIRA